MANYIISSGKSSDGIILERGAMSILEGGVANSTTVNSMGSMFISSGGVANSTTVNPMGRIFISSGGTASETFVNSRGSICVSSGGTAIGTIVDRNGFFMISSGGTAIDTVFSSGASFSVSSGRIFSGIVLNGQNIKLTEEYGTIMNGVVLNNGATLALSARRYGKGPVISGATVNFMGRLEVSSSCSVTDAVINSGGTMSVYMMGTLSNATVNSGGSLRVDRYGAAINVVENGGYVNATASANVFFLPNIISDLKLSNTAATVHEATTASGTEIGSGGRLVVFKNGKGLDTTVNPGGSLTVSYGGTATAIVENGGYVFFEDDAEVSFAPNKFSGLILTDAYATVHSGTTAADVTINEFAEFNVFEDGKLDSATVNSGGSLTVTSGGSATAIMENGGYVSCEDGATATFAANSFNGLVLTEASATVHSGTTATDITISEFGELDVFSGGTADSILLDDTSYLDVESGGTATGIVAAEGAVLRFAVGTEGWIQGVSGGLSFEMKDALISGYTVAAGGYLHVCDGGTAESIIVDYDGNLLVSGGGTAESITVDPFGCLLVSGGGTANGIVENGGYVELLDGATATFVANTFSGMDLDYTSATVHSGTTAANTTIGYYGMLAVFDGGTVKETTVSGTLNISGGAMAEETTVNGGRFNVSGDATAKKTILNVGSFTISDGGTAENTDLVSGTLTVSGGGTAKETTVNGGCFNVYSGATVNDTVFNSGSFFVSEGAVLNGATINCGSLIISSGVVLNSAAVNFGGSLYVSAGGTATAIAENGGYVTVQDGAEATFAVNTFSGLALSAASATVHSGTTATDTVIGSRGRFDLFSGGTATGTVVNTGGGLYVDNGGTADNIVENGGYVELADGASATFAANTFSGLALFSASATVHSGTTATDLTVNTGGFFNVCEGGVANGVTIDGGQISVLGGMANDATVNSGFIYIYSGGTADNAIINGGGIYVYTDGTANDAMVDGGYIEVSGGTANGIMLRPDGSISVSSGGVANDATVNGGYFTLYYGGTADNAIINGGLFEVSGGTANNAKVNAGGSICVFDGGTATGIVENGGYVELEDGGKVSFASNTFDGLVLADASATVHSGTTATDIKVKRGGFFNVCEGGVANGAAIIDGGYFVIHGGTANDVTLNSGGSIFVDCDGTAAGIVENGGYVEVEDGAEATFVSNTFSGLVLSAASATVHSGTTATDLTVKSGGYFVVLGGTATGATIDGGSINIYDGTANDVTLNSGGSIQVQRGGVADTVSIADGARFQIFSGGTATNITAAGGASLYFEVKPDTFIRGAIDGRAFELKDSVLSGYTMLNGSIGVASGGAANDTLIDSGAQLLISSGGAANGTIVEKGRLDISCGATADGVTVNAGGSIFVRHGAVAGNIVENGGYADVGSGADVSFAANSFSGLVLSGASATVHSGTTATDISVADNGGLAVFSGGTATDIAALEGAKLSFTVAPGTCIRGKYGDSAFEIQDAFITGYTVNAGGSLRVQSGGAAEETTISSYGSLVVEQGGTANGTTVNANGNFIVSSGGAADGITVNDGGYVYVEQGGIAADITINLYGCFVVDSDGAADGITVNAGGELYVASGGTAMNIVWTPCEGAVFIEDGASVSFAGNYSGVYCGSDNQLQRHVDILESQTVSGGSVVVISGGTVKDITLERGGRLAVFCDGAANGTVLNSNSILEVQSGGAVSGVTVNAGGDLYISAGGTATAIMENGGTVYLADGANVTFVSNTFSGLNLTRSNVTLHSGTTAFACGFRELIISEGGVASDCSYGAAYVLNGGLLADTNAYGGVIHVSSGGTAAHTSIWDGTSMVVSSGGVAVGNVFWTSMKTARLVVLSGGIVSNTVFQEYSRNGELLVSSGGTAIRTSAAYGSNSYTNKIRVDHGGVVIDTTVTKYLTFDLSADATAIGTILESGGRFVVRDKVLADHTTIMQGSLSVERGGRANDTVVQSNGLFSIYNGGFGDGVVVSSGGSLLIGDGGTLSGKIICNGGIISADTGAIVNFDLTQIMPGEDVRINDLSAIHGDPGYTLTIDPDVQPDGIYLLATGASDFSRTITVVNTVGTELGVLSVGEGITVDGTAYSLDLSDGALTLTVGEQPIPAGSRYTGEVIENGSMRQVESGQLFLETRILSGGRLSVLSGGTADGVAVEPDGKLDVLSGGTATGIVADSGARLTFAVAGDTAVAGTSAGSSFEIGNGVVSGYGIASGRLDVLSGGTADGVAVLSGGELGVSSGGSAMDVVWTPCVGSIFIAEGACVTFAEDYSGVYFGSDDRLISHAAALDGLTLGSAANAYVMSGGTVSGASVESGGQLHVSSGGTAMDIVWTPCVGSVSVAEGAYVTFAREYSGVYFGSGDRLISHAAALDGLTLNSAAGAYVMSDGTASGATVGSSGSMFVFSGGIASDVAVGPGGYLSVSSGGLVKDATLLNGSLHVFSGGYALAIVVSSGGRMSLASGGTAVGVYLMDSMRMSAGRIVGVMISSGGRMIADGGTLEYNVVCSDGGLFVGGGAATGTTVISGGSAVFSGGTADTVLVESGGSLEILSGAIAFGVEISSGGGMTVSHGGSVHETMLSGGMTVADGGSVKSTTVMYGGTANINSGGAASGTLISAGGTMTLNGGTICDTVIRGGSLVIVSGTLTGYCNFTNGYLSAADGAILNLDLTRMQPGVAAKISRLPSISGDWSLTVTVDADNQAEGLYLLADGVYGFDRTITVLGTDGTALGALACGETVAIGETTYTLSLSGSSLALQVGDDVTPLPYTSDGLAFGGSSRSVRSGEVFHDTTVLYGGQLIVASGGTAIDTTLAEETARLEVMFGGDASGATVLSGGGIQITRGGVLNGATVSATGGIYIYDGGIAYGANVTEDGNLHICSGGIASGLTISSGGTLWLHAGGTATDITLASGASLECVLTSETYLTGTSGGSAFEVKAGAVSNIAVTSACFYVRSGGSVDNVSLNSGGSIRVLTNIKQCIANNIILNPGGKLDVMPNGSATVAFNPWSGGIITSRYGRITYLKRDAKVYYGGSASGLISKANVMDDLEILPGNSAIVYQDGLIDHARVDSNGLLQVDAGGNASDTLVLQNGGMKIVSGGTATNVRIVSGGCLLCEDAFLAGKVSITCGGMLRAEKKSAAAEEREEGEETEIEEEDTFISACDGMVLDFDLTRTGSGTPAMVNDLSAIRGKPVYTLTVGMNEKPGTHTYVLADGADGFQDTISVTNAAGDKLGTLSVGGEAVFVGDAGYTLKLTGAQLSVTVDVPVPPSPENLVGTKDQVSWEPTGAGGYTVEYSTDGFEHVISVVTTGNSVDMPDLPAGTYQWRVRGGESEWATGDDIVSENVLSVPKVVTSDEDGNDDLFFASPAGTWGSLYYARHVGSINDWAGTRETISASGKGRIQNLFFGSADPNVLCLTDGDNGDALFVDDVYTDLPEGIEENIARLYRIQEIRAGAGDDIVDMTCQRVEYTGDGVVIRCGDGNDTVWANKGDNKLFGDAGNDHIVGASGNDLIAGGIGNDCMHGGGGNDVFTFCRNWGTDTVEQLADGTVTLWFASGDRSKWNQDTLTYADGENSVTVSGISADRVTLKFSDDGSDRYAALTFEGAFADFTSQQIFEESRSGMLAGL